MRYIHQQIEEITAFVKATDLHVIKCSYKGSSSPEIVEPIAIEDMLTRSRTLWGLALPYYVIVSSSVNPEALSLREAVTRVEATAARDEFLLIAYQDGGIISVSGMTFPFQEHAQRADWWQPNRL